MRREFLEEYSVTTKTNLEYEQVHNDIYVFKKTVETTKVHDGKKTADVKEKQGFASIFNISSMNSSDLVELRNKKPRLEDI